jgi:signal transduction histidine kinase
MSEAFTTVGSTVGAARERLDAWRVTAPGRLGLYAASVGVVAGVYYAAARIGLELAYLDGAVTALWPPVGVGLAALALYGLRLWPGVVIGDLLVADFSQPLGTVLGQTAGNTIAVVVAALLLRRLTGGRLALERVVDVAAFVACAVVAAGISACFGPPSLWLGDVIADDDLGRVFRTWFLGDTAGALVVTPLLLSWASSRTAGLTRRDAAEGAALLALLVVLAEVPSQRDVPYVVFPVLIWTALRFGPRGAATAIAAVTAVTVWNTAQDAGPFVRDSITDSLLATQFFIALAALTSLVLAAVTAERRHASAAVRALAEEQAALRRVATLVASEPAPSAVFEHVTREVGRVLGMPGASLLRYEDDEWATVVGAWSESETPRLPVGSTVSLVGDSVLARVRKSGSVQQVDYEHASGPLAQALREFGYRSAVAAPVKVGGRLWGALVAAATRPEPVPDEIGKRLCDFAELVAQALANADAFDKLAASRARVVEAGDVERRRLERNLHDGAQQRMVSLALRLRLVEAKLDDPAAARTLLAAARDELDVALDELRELARGIHPAMLTEHGLGAALEALVSRSAVPVQIDELPSERLPEAVEAAAYYVVAEAVTNVAKYADASSVTVSVRRANGHAVVAVSDDGVGGADPARGSGLRGLSDRLEALDGRLHVESPPERGTRIRAEIPLPTTEPRS